MIDAVPAILSEWFGSPDLQAPVPDALVGRWFAVDPSFDARLADRFGDLVKSAARGAFAAWEATPAGALALVLLLDQFPRNLYRGTAGAFEADPQALATAYRAIDAGHDQVTAPMQRAFFYVPCEHAEDLAIQERGVELFAALVADLPAGTGGFLSSTLAYAKRHRDVIARFGRFPHRNRMLGRATTDAEAAFLIETPGGF